jgi:hypothetical protein
VLNKLCTGWERNVDIRTRKTSRENHSHRSTRAAQLFPALRATQRAAAKGVSELSPLPAQLYY